MFQRLLCALFLCCSTAVAQLSWDRTEIATRASSVDQTVVARFAFTNSGSRPLKIEKTESHCDCIATELEGKEYAPGERGEIQVRFAVAGRVGLQRKTIEVFTNSAERANTTLSLSIQIDAPVQVSPAVLWWGVGGEKKTQRIRVTVAESAPLNFTGVECSNSRWRVELKTLTPGRDYAVEVTPQDTATTSAGLIKLITENPAPNPPVVTARLRIQ